MRTLSFGQPVDGIMQTAYVVPDLERAMRLWTEQLKVGPWFATERFAPAGTVYRGQPTEAACAIAMGYAGHMCIELIQPLDSSPSPFQEVIAKRGYGFHHWGLATRDLPLGIEQYRSRGYEIIMTARFERGGGVVYFDSTAELPGMIELIDLADWGEAMFQRFYLASVEWDGRDPVRSMF